MYKRQLLIAPAIAAVCATAGLYCSYYLDTASGAMIVLAQGAAFALAYLFAPRQGLLMRRAGGRRREAAALRRE